MNVSYAVMASRRASVSSKKWYSTMRPPAHLADQRPVAGEGLARLAAGVAQRAVQGGVRALAKGRFDGECAGHQHLGECGEELPCALRAVEGAVQRVVRAGRGAGADEARIGRDQGQRVVQAGGEDVVEEGADKRGGGHDGAE